MKKIIFKVFKITFIALVTQSCFAQNDYEKPPPINEHYSDFPTIQIEGKTYKYQLINDNIKLIINNHKYGILKNEKIVLPTIFNKYELFTKNNSLKNKIIFTLDDLIGVYDINIEKWVIPLKYKNFKLLDNNKILATKDNKTGIIDFENNILQDFVWNQSLTDINYPYIIVASDFTPHLFGLYDVENLKYILPLQYSVIYEITNLKRYIAKKCDLKKSKVVSPNSTFSFQQWYDNLVFNNKSNNFIAQFNDNYGVIDINEQIQIPFQYKYIDYLNDSLFFAKNDLNKFGIINQNGKLKLPFEYDNIKNYRNLLITNIDEKYGVLNLTKDSIIEILKCEYDLISFLNSSLIFKIQKNGKYGILDYNGKLIIPVEYDQIEIAQSNNNLLFIANKNNLKSLIDKSSNIINIQNYKSIKKLYDPFSYYNIVEGFKIIGTNDKAGLLDIYGHEIIPPLFDDFEFATKSLLIFKENNKYGIYDYFKNKKIISPIYSNISYSSIGFIGIINNEFYNLNTKDPQKSSKID